MTEFAKGISVWEASNDFGSPINVADDNMAIEVYTHSTEIIGIRVLKNIGSDTMEVVWAWGYLPSESA